MNTLTTIPVHKTGLDVDDDHEDSDITESILFHENNDGDDGSTEKPLSSKTH